MTTHLQTYLKDHLAGAAAAIELMDHVIGSHQNQPIAEVVARVRTDVEADRSELQLIVDRVGGDPKTVRQAAGWLGERLVQLKLAIDDSGDGDLRLLESLEILSLGIEGKSGLWRALAAASTDVVELRGADYERLIARAGEQRATIESLRIEAATRAFSPMGKS